MHALFLRSLRQAVFQLATGAVRLGSPGRGVSAALTLAVSGGALLAGALPTRAQPITGLADCAPPQVGEYLLLVVVPDEGARAKLDESLPPSVKAPTCNYLGSRVARMGGFRQPENADAWAAYLRDVASLPAFVAKPAQGNGGEEVGAGAIAATPPRQSVQDPAAPSGPSVAPAAAPGGTAPDAAPGPVTAVPAGDSSANPGLPAGTAFPSPMLDPTPSLATPVDVPPAIAAPASPSIAPVTPPTAPAVAPEMIAGTPPAAGAATNGPPIAAAPAPVVPSANPVVSSPAIAFAPRALGRGYAVLVDYGNQTAVVNQVRQLTQVPVGLAAYGQRPYLVARFTPQSSLAVETLTSLSDAGLRVILVEGNQVTLLTAEVQGQ